jgi:gamma-tubulin complex component 2
MLLKDQQLVPRLRSLKRFFFLSQSFFITHLLDLAPSELRRPAKSASIVKLQSLLELALNTDLHGEDTMFREDVRVTMAGSGLYEWLLKIISVNGVIGGEDGEGIDTGHAQDDGKKGKEDKKQILGQQLFPITGDSGSHPVCSY